MNFSTRCMQADDWTKISSFSLHEFSHPSFMGFEFMQWLDTLRNKCGMPFWITSSYRTIEHNQLVGGADDSAHCDVPCNAVDIGESPRVSDPNWYHSRFLIVSNALASGCSRIGLYANGSIHLDMTADRRPGERIWRVVGNI